MSSESGIQFACGLEGGHYYQIAESRTHMDASVGWSAVTPVSPESGVVQGSYALFHESLAGGARRVMPANIGAVGFMWRPETVPVMSGGVAAQIVSMDAGGLGGFGLGWLDTSGSNNNELAIVAQGSSTIFKKGTLSYVPDGTPANTKNYWIWMIVLDGTTEAVDMIWIHDFTSGVINVDPIEVIYASSENGDISASQSTALTNLRLGQTAGTSTAGWYIDNIVVTKTRNVSPALAPSFVATVDKSLGAVATGSAIWVAGDGGGAGEETYIEDIPVDHATSAQWLKHITNAQFGFQSYATEDGLASGENVLGAAAWADQYSSHITTFFHYVGWQTSGGVFGSSAAMQPESFGGWEYTAFFADELDPDNNDWTPALLDSAKLAHQGFILGTAREARIAGLFAEIVYGPDNRYEFIVPESGYAITAVASAFIPRVMVY